MNIHEVIHCLKGFKEKVEAEILILSAEQLQQAEKTGAWSILQLMQHLHLASMSYVEQIEKQLIYQKFNAAEQIETTFVGRIFWKFVDDQIPFKFPAPPLFKPAKKLENGYQVDDFMAFQRYLLTTAKKLAERDFNSFFVRSPLSSFLRFKAGEALHIVATHQERHLKQIVRVKKQIALIQ